MQKIPFDKPSSVPRVIPIGNVIETVLCIARRNILRARPRASLVARSQLDARCNQCGILIFVYSSRAFIGALP